jgi:hypothetical protein
METRQNKKKENLKNNVPIINIGDEIEFEYVDEYDTCDSCIIALKNSIQWIGDYMYGFSGFFIQATSVYFMWIFLHYASSHCYVYFCTPNSFQGFVISPFIITAPHCKALRWVIFNGSIAIDNMWVVFGTWLCSKIILPQVKL